MALELLFFLFRILVFMIVLFCLTKTEYNLFNYYFWNNLIEKLDKKIFVSETKPFKNVLVFRCYW